MEVEGRVGRGVNEAAWEGGGGGGEEVPTTVSFVMLVMMVMNFTCVKQ